MPLHAFGVSGFGVLSEVDTGGLVFGAEAEAHHPVDQFREDERHRECIERDDDNGERLLAQLAEAAAVQQTPRARCHDRRGEQSDQRHSDNPADEVHTDHIERIVIVEAEFRSHRERAHDPRRETHDRRAERVDGSAGRGDGDQSGDHTGCRAERGGPAVPDLFDREPAEHAEAARNERIEEDGRGKPVGGQRRTGIEPEPAEPQQPDTEQDERQIMWPHGVFLEADARSEHQRQCQRGGAGDDLDHQAAGVVEHAQLGQPAAGSPYPVRDN